MKILVVSERYWPDGSGAELATHLLIGVLKSFFEITVVTGTKKPKFYKGVKYIYTDLLSAREKQKLWINGLLLCRNAWFKDLVKKSDFVYVPRFSFPVIELARKYGKKTIVHLHDYIPISYTATVLAPAEKHLKTLTRDDISLALLKKPLYGLVASTFFWMPKLVRYWISRADTIICVSKRHAEIISRAAPKLAKKITVIYNPLPPTPPPGKKSEKPILIYAGGESYVKGFHIVLKIIPEVLHEYSNIRFILTGNLSFRTQKLLQTINKVFSNRVVYLGRIPYKKVLKIYSKSWVLLFPSVWEEPLPYVIMEAASMNTIPIASKVGGVREIIGGTYAEKLMFNHWDRNELIAKIVEILSASSDMFNDAGRELRENVLLKFGREKVCERLLKVFLK